MAEENPLVYSPIQNSVYTAIEYKAHSNGAAPDMSPAELGSTYYQEATNLVPRGGRVVTREGTDRQIGSAIISEGYLGGFEWILPNGSAMVLAAYTGGLRRLDTAANSWEVVSGSAFTVVASGSHVDFVPMRTASSGIRVIAVPESEVTAATQEQLVWWNGSTSTTFTALTTAVTGNCGVVWRSHFLLGDTFDSADGRIPYRIHWSALGDPTVWSGTASAGSLDLTDGNLSKVMRFLPLRKELAVYKEFGVYTLTYKGNPFWFTQTLLSEQVNLLGRNAVCSVLGGDYHFLFSSDGMLLWDGQTVKRVGKDRVDRTILGELDWSNLRYVNCCYFPPKKEVLVTYYARASGGQSAGFRSWVYNLEYDSWWKLSSVVPIGGAMIYKIYSSAAPALMASNRNFGDATERAGYVVGYYTGGVDANLTTAGVQDSSIPVTVAMGPLDFGHFAHKRALKVSPILQADPLDGVSTAGTTISGTIWERETSLDVNNGGTNHSFTYVTSPGSQQPLVTISDHLAGRYFRIRLSWSSTDMPITLGGVVYRAALRAEAREDRG